MSKNWQSSYEENNYGELFYSLVKIYKPKKIVELGTKAGYSAYHMAWALSENGFGTIDCYDLWEKYVESYGFDFIPKSIAEKNLKQFSQITRLFCENAFETHNKYKQADILHVDLDNDASVLEKTIPKWIDKIRDLIIIEGGSRKRDYLDKNTSSKKMPVAEWIESFSEVEEKKRLTEIIGKGVKNEDFVVVEGDDRFKKPPMFEWLTWYAKKRKDIEYITLEPFPSLTIIKKKC